MQIKFQIAQGIKKLINCSINKCQQSSSDYICSKCQSSYYLYQYQCQGCLDQNCDFFNNTGQCLTCIQGYFLKDNKCELCLKGCGKCNDGLTCSNFIVFNASVQNGECKCPGGSYEGLLGVKKIQLKTLAQTNFIIKLELNNSFTFLQKQVNILYKICKCLRCISPCRLCTSQTFCTDCINILSTRSDKSCGCKDGQYLDKANQMCIQCDNSCGTCSSNSICDTCASRFEVRVPGVCDRKCLANSTIIQDSNGKYTCQCNKGYFPVLNRRPTYGICVKNCNKNEVYDDNYNCICSPLYLREDIQQNISCVTSCKKEQYFDKVNLTCSQCLPEYVNKCQLNCSKNEYMDCIGICRLCHKSCSECKGPLESDCLSCTNKLVFQPTLKKCAQCEQGQFYDENKNMCDYCDYTCFICSGKKANECILCQVGLYLSPISNKCLKELEYQKQQEQIKQLKEIGFIQDNQKLENNDCKSQFETSQFLNKILEISSIINLVLAFFSSVFTPSGSIISWVFIQNQQVIGNYIFSTRFSSIWTSSLELKASYAN
ncbi:hypothetical protein ABPG72_011596 [Tetrahymena utriculariae]